MIPQGLIFLLIAIYALLSTGEDVTTCKAFFVIAGESTNITCYFPNRTNILNKDVLIFKRYIKNTIYKCSWNSTTETYDHEASTGYESDCNITDTLIIKIPEAQINMSGLYKCVIQFQTETECLLEVTDCPSTTCSSTSCPNTSQLNTLSIVLIATTSLAIIIIIILIICLCKCRKAPEGFQEIEMEERNTNETDT